MRQKEGNEMEGKGMGGERRGGIRHTVRLSSFHLVVRVCERVVIASWLRSKNRDKSS